MNTTILIASLWTAIASLFSPSTTCDSNGSAASVQACHDQAQPGDTITLPGGAFTWTTNVNITKNISIIGNGTTINDAVLKTGNAFHGTFNCHPTPAGLLRISGIHFQGTSGTIYSGSDGEINIDGVSATPNVRVDNCSFTGLFMRPINFNGSIYGVVDHCQFTMTNWTGGISIRHSTWKGVGNYGDNSWADDPHWGSEQAVFIEDCTFDHFGGATFIDGDGGMRVVVRHNAITSSEAGNHGTETSQRFRSGRTFELYQNHMDGGPGGCGGACERGWVMFARGGSGLVWGNYFDRYDRIVRMEEYRYFFSATPWKLADGADGFDSNDPAGPFVTSTATGGTGLTMTDSTKSWDATNGGQWRGYSLRNLSTGKASSIKSNTATTITFDPDAQSGNSMSFAAAQSYDIRKVNLILDQPGRGKGDLMPSVATPPPVYPNQALEPIRVWGNTLGPGFGNNNGVPKITAPYNLLQDRDWFYSADDSAKPAGYTPFVYPHPLVGGTPSPTATATPSPGPSSSPTTTPAATPTPNGTSTPTSTPANTPSATATATAGSPTPVATATATATSSPSATATASPTGTATPSPTTTPAATSPPTPTPTPGGTPTPTGSPIPPTECTVPNLVGRRINAAEYYWRESGFDCRNITTVGSATATVRAQSLPAGTMESCATAAVTVQSR